ncbi:MAG: response regulator [Nitrosopumilales archaeon]|nr:response regulator [Nitrosopumilales archaeon]
MTESGLTVLIIEDSTAISVRIKEILETIGYHKIYTAKDGASGISMFKEIMEKNGSSPVVFLDYTLPDSHGRAVLSQILTINPKAKVILETAKARDDFEVTQIIGEGVFQYIGKPFRYDDIKKTMDMIEEENRFLQRETEMIENLQKAQKEIYEQVDHFLRSSIIISLQRLVEYTKSDKDTILSYLNDLVGQGKVVRTENMKETTCNQCGSVKLATLFHCPSCKKSDFKNEILIEHYPCENFSAESTYKNNMCPKCRKEIKILGVDYRAVEQFICNNCNDKFPELSIDFLCLRCNNQFKLDKSTWSTSPGFKAIKL